MYGKPDCMLKTGMVEEPSNVKHLSLHHMCKIRVSYS